MTADNLIMFAIYSPWTVLGLSLVWMSAIAYLWGIKQGWWTWKLKGK